MASRTHLHRADALQAPLHVPGIACLRPFSTHVILQSETVHIWFCTASVTDCFVIKLGRRLDTFLKRHLKKHGQHMHLNFSVTGTCISCLSLQEFLAASAPVRTAPACFSTPCRHDWRKTVAMPAVAKTTKSPKLSIGGARAKECCNALNSCGQLAPNFPSPLRKLEHNVVGFFLAGHRIEH